MSLLTSVQESQPGSPYYLNVSSGGGGGGGAGSFTTLTVTASSTLSGVTSTFFAVTGQASFTSNVNANIVTVGGGGLGGTATFGSSVTNPSNVFYSKRQTATETTQSNIAFTSITVFNGTYTCTVRGADNVSFYSALASVWGTQSTGAGQEIVKIGDSSNVAADPSSQFYFTTQNIGGGQFLWSPVFRSAVVTSGSNFTCTLSPNFG